MGEYKVVVMGSGGVGKSALTIQFVQGTFTEKYDPTIEVSWSQFIWKTEKVVKFDAWQDFYRKNMYVGDEPVTLEILDTAGTEQFASMRDLYIRNGQGFILVFSIINSQTFREVLNLHQQILRAKGTNQVRAQRTSDTHNIPGLFWTIVNELWMSEWFSGSHSISWE